MNAFESGLRKVIPAVLIYASFEQSLLMIHRKGRGTADYHDGKWNGVGGKLDLDESAVDGARREFWEEAGVEIPADRFRCLGTLYFPNFKPHKSEDWAVWVMALELETAEQQKVFKTNPEGELHWVPFDQVLEKNLWGGDRHFMHHVLSRSSFHGTIWYEGESVSRVQVISG